MRLLLPRGPFLLVLAACANRPVEEPPPAPAKQPEAFAVRGEPVVVEPFLPPDAAWRHLVSQLTLLRTEGADLLVTFDERAFHATDREGRRRTWRLPAGLSLRGTAAALLLRADLSIDAGAVGAMQVVDKEEVTVVTGRIDTGGNVQEFRLVAQGGIGFRSISTGGDRANPLPPGG